MKVGNIGDDHASGFVGIEGKLLHQKNIYKGMVPYTLLSWKLYWGNKIAEMISEALDCCVEVCAVSIEFG